MKYCLFFPLCLISWIFVAGQEYMTKANACYDQKWYQCAIDNYSMALSNKAYVEADLYKVQYRIGDSYFSLKQYDKAEPYLKAAIAARPSYVYGVWALADTYYNTKKYDSAVVYYKRSLSLEVPADERETIIWFLGNSFYNKGNYRDALNELGKISKRTGELVRTEALIGQSYQKLYKHDSALYYFKKSEGIIPQTDPVFATLKYLIGKSYHAKSLYADEMAALDAALRLKPDYYEVFWQKGICLVAQDEYLKAIDWYKKAIPGYTDSLNLYTLRNNIANCYRNTGNYTETVNWLQQALLFSQTRYYEYPKIAALQYNKLARPQEAEKTCRAGITENELMPAASSYSVKPQTAKLYAILGKIALNKKDTAKAMEHFSAARALSISNYEANLAAGDIAWNRKNNEDIKRYYSAIYKSDYDTLLTGKADIARAYARIAYTDLFLNNKSANYISSDVSSALRYDSMQKEVILLWPYVLQASAYDLGNKRKSCLSLLDRGIKTYAADKEYSSNLYNLKAVTLESKDTTAIRKALEQALQVFPENVSAWDNYMKYLSSYDNYAGIAASDKLIAILKKKKASADVATAMVYKGDFYWRLNKKPEARQVYQEALVWDANNATAKERVQMH